MRKRRKNKRNRKIIMITGIFLLLFMSAGYAAFQTNLGITAKGNIKNIKDEVDSKVPTDELLFWGQADNEENTLTLLKDKSGNNHDGIMYGFDNTNLSGYTDEGLVFDGLNDYVDLGLANYDFKNSISYVMYVDVVKNDVTTTQELFGNWQNSGGGIYTDGNSYFAYDEHDGNNYNYAVWYTKVDNAKYYTLVGIYDGVTVKMYVDGKLEASVLSNSLSVSDVPIFIGANPPESGSNFANIVLKEAMLYDRVLTEEEVKTITDGFERKYK